MRIKLRKISCLFCILLLLSALLCGTAAGSTASGGIESGVTVPEVMGWYTFWDYGVTVPLFNSYTFLFENDPENSSYPLYRDNVASGLVSADYALQTLLLTEEAFFVAYAHGGSTKIKLQGFEIENRSQFPDTKDMSDVSFSIFAHAVSEAGGSRYTVHTASSGDLWVAYEYENPYGYTDDRGTTYVCDYVAIIEGYQWTLSLRTMGEPIDKADYATMACFIGEMAFGVEIPPDYAGATFGFSVFLCLLFFFVLIILFGLIQKGRRRTAVPAPYPGKLWTPAPPMTSAPPVTSYCRYCGAPVPAGSLFCSNCDKPIVRIPSEN